MELGLKGKIVFVSGSGRGIGLAIAGAFASEGAKVILNDISAESLAGAKKTLEEKYPGVRVASALGSVSDPADAERIFAGIGDKFGCLDIIVNNAGILRDMPMLDMPFEDWKRIFSNNLDAIFLSTRYGSRLMKPERHPVILNCGSFGGVIPACGYSAYNASKAAIANLTRTMAGELNPLGIRVAGYIPGVTATEIIAPMLERENDRLVAQIPLRRLARPEDIASCVVFLGSEPAGYINGTMVEVAGGKLCVQNVGRYAG